ncbi:MAG: hypothetical protein VYA30_05110 [Myxococcota bacterium]|nr:hypothetical protein [Myxococcota bacterium]
MWLAITLCVVGSITLGCSQRQNSPKPPQPPPAATSVNADTPDTITMADCEDCHPSQTDAFKATGMGRSLYKPNDQPVIENFDVSAATVTHPQMAATYRAYRDSQNRWWQEERVSDEVVQKVEVQYIIGSGNHSRSYLGIINNELIQLPLTWYSQAKKWDLSPGYEGAGHMRFLRPIGPECLFCHNNLTPHVDGTKATYRWPLAEGIGCDRCHGDGSLHVSKRRAGDTVPAGHSDPTIINPKHLPPKKAFEICQQCHLQGHVRLLLPDQRWDVYDIKDDLASHHAVYGLPTKQHSVEIASHAERLLESKCFKLGKKSLQCTDCHQPHQHQVKPIQNVCNDCHQDKGCTDPAGLKANSPCADCHMPNVRVSDAPHMKFTDHKIQRTRLRSQRITNGAYRPLKALLQPTGTGLQVETYRALADTLASVRGDKYIKRLGPAMKALIPYLSHTTWYKAWSIYGRALLVSGRSIEAVSAFDKASTLAPDVISFRSMHIQALLNAKNHTRAQQLAADFVVAQPDNGFAHGLLAMSLQRLGRHKDAHRSYGAAVSLLPNDSSLHFNWGMNSLDAGDPKAASEHWARAIEVDPLNVDAHIEMITYYRANGMSTEANNQAVRAYRANPRNGRVLLEIARESRTHEAFSQVFERYNAAILADPKQVAAYLELSSHAAANNEPLIARDALFRGQNAVPSYPHWVRLQADLKKTTEDVENRQAR